MKRLAFIPFAFVLAACPGEKKVPPADTIKADTVATDLSQVTTALPPAAPDTFTPRKLPTVPVARAASIPEAPPALVEAVEREQSFSKFCYTEFGKKADPSLIGNVAMIVTVGSGGITDATVGASNWSGGTAGKAVNKCLEEKAKQAWKLPAGAVKSGKYQVQLTFRGG
jgi:hypothetical protein